MAGGGNKTSGGSTDVFIAKYAADNGCARIDWTAAGDNEAVGRLYRNLGAEEVDKAFFRLRMPDFGGLLDEG